MRIQHNIAAMNSYRNYNNNTSALNKNLEKLSSGYKINRAGDDAAGLAISEKMRAQITGLNAAQKNVKDGISFVKTAEGAMQEIEDMLNRMKYLATQSANGTYDDPVDRANLDKEVTALKSEIDRIAESANFNGSYMLKGPADSTGGTTATSASFTSASVAGYTVTVANPDDVGAGDITVSLQKTEAVTGASVTGTVAGTVAGLSGWKLEGGKTDALNGKTLTVVLGATGVTVSSVADDGDGNLTVTLAGDSAGTTAINTAAGLKSTIESALSDAVDNDGVDAAWKAVKITAGATGTWSAPTTAGTLISATTLDNGVEAKAAGYTITVTSAKGTDTMTATTWAGNPTISVTGTTSGAAVTIDTTKVAEPTATASSTKVGTVSGGGSSSDPFTINLQIGDDYADYNTLKVQIGSMKTDAFMGQKFSMTTSSTDGTTTYTATGGSTIKDISIASYESASKAIDTIKQAINYVSSVRGDLGALQNRLDHTANNLSVMTENIQDAESTIRDTDVAEEMMSYVKNNILIQSAQAMLAQANQVPQGVLQLLG